MQPEQRRDSFSWNKDRTIWFLYRGVISVSLRVKTKVPAFLAAAGIQLSAFASVQKTGNALQVQLPEDPSPAGWLAGWVGGWLRLKLSACQTLLALPSETERPQWRPFPARSPSHSFSRIERSVTLAWHGPGSGSCNRNRNRNTTSPKTVDPAPAPAAACSGPKCQTQSEREQEGESERTNVPGVWHALSAFSLQ